MKHPMMDVLVVIPGILGSSLYREGNGRALWDVASAPVVDVLRTWFRNLKELRLPAGIGDEPADDGVVPKALIPDVRLPLALWTFDLISGSRSTGVSVRGVTSM